MTEMHFARFVLWIFHPLLMLFYAFLILLSPAYTFIMVLDERQVLLVLGLVLLSSCLMPALTLYIFRISKASWTGNTSEHLGHTFPYLVTAVFLYGTAFLVKSMELPGLFYLLTLGATLLVIITLFLNIIFQPDIHSLALGALIGTLGAFSLRWNIGMNWIIILLLGVSGLCGYASLVSRQSTPPAVYAGFLIGSLGMFLLFSTF